MAQTLPDDPQELALGIGAGALSFVLGLAFMAVVVTDAVDVLSHPAVAGGLVGVVFAYGVAGLYELVARGTPKRGVADLFVSAGLVLGLLAPYGDPARGFAATGAVALLVSAVYHGALAADLIATDEEPDSDSESESTVGVDGEEA